MGQVNIAKIFNLKAWEVILSKRIFETKELDPTTSIDTHTQLVRIIFKDNF